MAIQKAELSLIGSPYLPNEGIRKGSELDEPGLRELAGRSEDKVRMPFQHGHADNAMPAWTVSAVETWH